MTLTSFGSVAGKLELAWENTIASVPFNIDALKATGSGRRGIHDRGQAEAPAPQSSGAACMKVTPRVKPLFRVFSGLIGLCSAHLSTPQTCP